MIMQEQLGLVEEVYSLVVNFAVTYSFQLLGAVVVLIAVSGSAQIDTLRSCMRPISWSTSR